MYIGVTLRTSVILFNDRRKVNNVSAQAGVYERRLGDCSVRLDMGDRRLKYVML